MFFRFLLVGGSGFLIDAGLTYLLISLGVVPWLARIPAIAVAMAFTWIANRCFTYQVKTARTANEAMRYVAVAILMALINYLVYLVQVSNGIWPVVAVAIATALQAILSFHLYRYMVFGGNIEINTVVRRWARLELSWLVPLFALVSGIISTIMFWWHRGSLWEDEIIAITHGLETFPYFFVEVLRNDIHPFLYFLLLKLWSAPFIGSDSWALASSMVSSFFSAAVIWYITHRIYGQRAALWTVALYFVLPTTIAAAGNLRMYGLMPGIAIMCWYANREYLQTGQYKWAISLVLLQVLQTYTHAIGFFFAAFFALSGLIEQWGNVGRRRLGAWLVAQTISVFMMLPAVGSALIRGTEPLPAPGLMSLLSFPAHLISGGQAVDFPMPLLFGGVTFVFLLGFALIQKASRIPSLVITCGSLLVCMVISNFGKPMFKPPVFTSNLVPFLVLGAGVAISNSELILRKSIAFIYVGFLSISVLFWASNEHVSGNYQPAASYIYNHATSGDVVVVPNVSVFWGILRYAVAPDWGHPLTTMPFQSNEAWTKLKERLGPKMVQILNLNAKTDYVDSNGVRYVIGNKANKHVQNSERVWIVHRDNYKESVDLGKPMKVEEVAWFGKELAVSLLRADSTGKTIIDNPIKIW